MGVEASMITARQSDRAAGFEGSRKITHPHPTSPLLDKRTRLLKGGGTRKAGIEHLLNTRTGRNIPKNQRVTAILKEGL